MACHFNVVLNLEAVDLETCLGSSHWFMRRSSVVSLGTPLSLSLSLSLSHDVYKCSNVRSITQSQAGYTKPSPPDITGLGKRVGLRLRESRLLTPSGRVGGGVHAT